MLEKDRDPAWDLITKIDPSLISPRYANSEAYRNNKHNEDKDAQNDSKNLEAVWLLNWYEACEILISHGPE
jgi:hypothetical protein